MMREETKKQFNEPIWSTVDLYKAVAYAILLGLAIGFIWGYDVASPDLSKQPVTYLRG